MAAKNYQSPALQVLFQWIDLNGSENLDQSQNYAC